MKMSKLYLVYSIFKFLQEYKYVKIILLLMIPHDNQPYLNEKLIFHKISYTSFEFENKATMAKYLKENGKLHHIL